LRLSLAGRVVSLLDKFGTALSVSSAAFGFSPTTGTSALLLTVVPALLAALLPTVLALLAALLAALLSKLLPILPALLPFLAVVLPISGPVVVTATAALTGTIALASRSVSTSAVPAPTAPTGLVGATSVSPAHLFLLALSTA
jgi:hypothetical protein